MVACICGVNAASTALHASLGFVPIGTLPEVGKKFGKWLSILIMQLILAPTAQELQTSQS
jgi:L-amino acid N-acyltransferase